MRRLFPSQPCQERTISRATYPAKEKGISGDVRSSAVGVDGAHRAAEGNQSERREVFDRVSVEARAQVADSTGDEKTASRRAWVKSRYVCPMAAARAEGGGRFGHFGYGSRRGAAVLSGTHDDGLVKN